jgi:hypothetical protein
VHIISVDNDCKEVLFFCTRENNCAEPDILTTELSTDEEFKFRFSQERAARPELSEPLKYVYEPGISILKAGAFKLISQAFSVAKVHSNTHLYTSDKFLPNFPGRVFENLKPIERVKKITTLIPSGKANIITRNYPLKPDELRKKLGLEDGGDDYVLAFTGRSSKQILHAKRIK